MNQNYVALASSSSSSSSKPELVEPVRGIFVGPSNIKSELKWDIEITWFRKLRLVFKILPSKSSLNSNIISRYYPLLFFVPCYYLS